MRLKVFGAEGTIGGRHRRTGEWAVRGENARFSGEVIQFQSVERKYAPNMARALLENALKQAERSEPAIRAAAYLHIARVLALSDQPGAERVLEEGIALARQLDTRAGSLILGNAVSLAAAVSPKHAIPLYAEHRRVDDPFGSGVVSLLNAMAEHGHLDDALAYFDNPLPGDRFPLHFVGNLDHSCRDEPTRRRLLDLALREWRNPVPRHEWGGPFEGQSFTYLFARRWTLFPRDVATPTVKELLRSVLDMKSEARRHALTEDPDDPAPGSAMEFMLFQLLPALRDLTPELVESVLEGRPELAAAAKCFPNGMRSIAEGQRKYDPSRDDVVVVGDSAFVRIAEALATGFEASFREAYLRLAEDTDAENPNEGPKECWPSAREFRHILFKAGQHLGLAAEKYLDRIPDPDLRLFARIELCAGIAGLPEMGGLTTVGSRRGQQRAREEFDRSFGEPIPAVRCPKCAWTPRERHQWVCRCGHRWNTFDTRGLCPGCGHQWEVTACLRCGVLSPHADWYREA